jgi:hypothetical protein
MEAGAVQPMSAEHQPPVRPAISVTELLDAPGQSGRCMRVRAQLPSLLVNAVAPFVAYQVLTVNEQQ